MTHMETNAQVAATILQQLGGNQFLAMAGARNLLYGENALTMKLGRNAQKVTHLRVELDASDTYTVDFYRMRGTAIIAQETVGNVYHDQLRALFTAHTGMETRL
jgi:hypothetical protein